MSRKVWLITGCSSGFGEGIARYALERGQTVIATARGDPKQRLATLGSAGATLVSLDVTSSPAQLKQIIDDLVSQFHRIDVLVNNAGMVQTGTVEEVSDDEWRSQFEVNVFGLLNLKRAVLPHMRRQNAGTICNIGSQAGRKGMATIGAYCATKFALEGLTEALAAELVDHNVKCIIFEPGDFRSEVFASGNFRPPKIPLPEAYRKDLGRDWENEVHGKQRGSIQKGSRAIVDALLQTERPLPIRLALGPDAVQTLRTMAEHQLQTVKDWEKESTSTDHDDVEQY